MFGIGKRKQEEAERKRKDAEYQIEKKKSERQALVQSWLEKEVADREKSGEESMKEDVAECDAKNSVCPKCGGKNIINRYVLISLSGHDFGNSAEEIDLESFKVNECKACGNQWEIARPLHSYSLDYTVDNYSPYDYSGYLGFLYRRIKAGLEGQEKPEPKKLLEVYKNTPKEVLECCLYRQACYQGDMYDEKILGTKIVSDILDPQYNANEYLYRISDEAWRIAKTFIGREI